MLAHRGGCASRSREVSPPSVPVPSIMGTHIACIRLKRRKQQPLDEMVVRIVGERMYPTLSRTRLEPTHRSTAY
jgi:hypothetical protein